MVVEVLEKKVTDSKKEISKAIKGQYADPGRTVEIKREKGSIYLGDKPIGTDGANEHDYAQEKGIKVDYSKLFKDLGSGVKKTNETEETQVQEQQKEERPGEMKIMEMMETMDEMYIESAIPSGGNHVDYQKKEGLDYALQTSPHKMVWFKFWEESSSVRTKNTNFSLNNMLN